MDANGDMCLDRILSAVEDSDDMSYTGPYAQETELFQHDLSDLRPHAMGSSFLTNAPDSVDMNTEFVWYEKVLVSVDRDYIKCLDN